MSHLINVESSGNPFAIGVVGARLAHQPTSLGEAEATVRMLESRGYNYSLGITQINRANLARYGLNSLSQVFDPCLNMAVGSRILYQCYARSDQDWGKAFSCYYSGNFATGFHDGYVRKVYESIRRGLAAADTRPPAQAIPLRQTAVIANRARPMPHAGSSAYRIAIRSMALDTLTDTLVEGYAKSTPTLAPPAPRQQASVTATGKAQTKPLSPPPVNAKPDAQGPFVPRVTVSGTSFGSTMQPKHEKPSKHIDHPAEGRDSAFVF
ncbi:lytic transglycosylase domain-containing protein [Dyella aluminiiresistens]|uniref:lytic transglycosylase domain-containing protein n=1 Tax=Dyella aluminiiresistens TaxID=3069105 RepID=UPI00399D0E0A